MCKTETIDFLQNLQEQLRYEDEFDYDMQANPRFWVVGDYKWIVSQYEDAERYSVVIPEWAEVYELEEFIERCIENEDGELDDEQIQDFKECGCEETALWWIQEYIDEDAYLVPEEQVHYIVPNTMFITKEEAREHIRINHYHYTDKAHTYAMTAWRSPSVSKLWDILRETDWSEFK